MIAKGVSRDYEFPVSEETVYIHPKGDYVQVPAKKAIVREDNGHVLAIVSDKYKVLPHAQVVEGFREALKGKTLEENIQVTKGGARLYMEMTLPEVTVEVKSGDPLALKLIAVNSYDGSHVLQVMFGAFRLVCSNGAIFGEKFINLEQKHVGTIGVNVESIAMQVAILTDKFRGTLPVMQRMAKAVLDEDTKVLRGELFDTEATKLPEYLLDAAYDSYVKEGDGTVYGYWNSLTYAITHKMRRESPAAQIGYGRIAWELAKSHIAEID